MLARNPRRQRQGHEQTHRCDGLYDRQRPHLESGGYQREPDQLRSDAGQPGRLPGQVPEERGLQCLLGRSSARLGVHEHRRGPEARRRSQRQDDHHDAGSNRYAPPSSTRNRRARAVRSGQAYSDAGYAEGAVDAEPPFPDAERKHQALLAVEAAAAATRRARRLHVVLCAMVRICATPTFGLQTLPLTHYLHPEQGGRRGCRPQGPNVLSPACLQAGERSFDLGALLSR
jgi:hypothetical protein